MDNTNQVSETTRPTPSPAQLAGAIEASVARGDWGGVVQFAEDLKSLVTAQIDAAFREGAVPPEAFEKVGQEVTIVLTPQMVRVLDVLADTDLSSVGLTSVVMALIREAVNSIASDRFSALAQIAQDAADKGRGEDDIPF